MTQPSAAPGTPVAVRLCTTSVETVVPFYRSLLGWEVEESGDRLLATAAGAPVADIAPYAGPSGWLTVFTVDDLPATTERAARAGGSAPDGPPAADHTRRLVDPAGVSFLVTGAATPAAPPAPGRPAWHEYMTTDASAADDFYRKVLGLRPVRPDGAPGDDYVLLTAAGRPVAGRLAVPAELVGTLPTGWMVYFACPDVDGVADQATRLGGTVVVPPRDAPTGRVSAVVDPAGAVFTLIRPAAR